MKHRKHIYLIFFIICILNFILPMFAPEAHGALFFGSQSSNLSEDWGFDFVESFDGLRDWVSTEGRIGNVSDISKMPKLENGDNPNDSDYQLLYYSMDSQTLSKKILEDLSGNDNDAIVNEAYIVDDHLKGDGDLSFDGENDHVNLNKLDISGESLTIIAWINIDDFDVHDARIVSKSTGVSEQDHYWMLSTIADDGYKLRFRLKTNGVTSTLVASDGNLEVNKWTHVAAVYDGSEMLLYKDAELVGSIEKTGAVDKNNTVNAWIGNNPSGDKSFDGIIDELRIFKKALTHDEIRISLNDDTSVDNNYFSKSVWMNFDELPVTGENEIPGSGGGWLYTTARENPDNNYPMTQHDLGGWRNTVSYPDNPNVFNYFRRYYNSYYSDHMGWPTYGYIEIDDKNVVKGNSLEYRVTGGVNAILCPCGQDGQCNDGTNSPCLSNGIQIKTKQQYLDAINSGQNPIEGGIKIEKFNPYSRSVWVPFKLASPEDESRLTPGTTIYFAIKDISQVDGDSQVPIDGHNLYGSIRTGAGGRDYQNYPDSFDYEGDQPVLNLIKRIDYTIPKKTDLGAFEYTESSENEQSSIYCLSLTGTRTSGVSVLNDWSNTNCYNNLHDIFSEMSGGNTIIVNDGVYTGSQNAINSNVLPPNGTIDSYTTIKSRNIGQVIFDGENLRQMVDIQGDGISYIQFDGLGYRNSNTDLFRISNSDHVKVLNSFAFNACGSGKGGDGFIVTHSSYVLFEDCWSYGAGRKHFYAGRFAEKTIFRRCVARHDRHFDYLDQEGFKVYDAKEIELQNCIVIDGDQGNYYTHATEVHPARSYSVREIAEDGYIVNDVYIRGSMSIGNDDMIGFISSGDCQNDICSYYIHDFVHLDSKLGIRMRAAGSSFNHCTLGKVSGTDNWSVLAYLEYGDPITNSLLFDGAFRGIWSAVGNDYNAMYDVDEIDYLWTSPGSHSYCEDNANAMDPISGTPGNGIPALKYPVKIEDGSNLDGTASDNGDRGATILNKIGIDGSLWGDQSYNEISEESLWPFPNEDLIKQTMKSYSYDNGNLTGNRGFADSTAKQLNGIDDVTLTSYIWEYLGNPIPCEIYHTCETDAPRHIITAFIYTDNGQMTVTTGQDQFREIVMVEKGDDVILNFSSNDGYTSKIVYVDGIKINVEGNTYTFSNVQNNHTFAVGFFDSLIGNSYTITSHSDSGGVIVPSGEVYVKEGYNAIFYAVPDIGHNVEDLIIDGVDLSSHTEGNILFQNVSDNHEISFGFTAEERYAYKTIDDINLWEVGDIPPENTINPDNIKYMGSFKLPQSSNGYPFGYGAPIAYNPNGNSSAGEVDYPGSLYFLEGNVNHVVSEISIPTPIISENKDESILNTAEIIRPFVKIDTGIDDTEPIVGLEYISSQSKLFFGGGRVSYGDAERPNIGWIDDTFENIAGLWHVGNMTPYQYGAWTVFEIPQSWADKHTDGRTLIVGRGREGWGTGMGPSLYAIAPWQDGNPPANNSQLNYTTLLEYGNTMSQAIDLYNSVDTDFYHEGAWLEDNSKSAVILLGTRSFGTIWYEHAHYAGHKRHVMVFFNPDDFVDVIQGKKLPYEPQPYALFDLTEYLYGKQYDDRINSYGYLSYIARNNSFLKGAAYDRERNIIYVTEYNVLGKRHDQPIIHVFKINFATSPDTEAPMITNGFPTGALSSGTTTTEISISTNENAICSYAETANSEFSSMTIFETTGNLSHSTNIAGLQNGQSFTYFIKCQDQLGHTNTSDYEINFSINKEIPDISSIIVDHTCTDITKIPESAITQSKNNLHIAYGHTSHGSQLISGMNGLDAFLTNSSKFDITPGLFVWNDGPQEGYLDLDDYAMKGDVGYYPQWENNTRSYLGDPDPTTGRGTDHSDVNVIIWSWCGQVDSKYASGTLDSHYLTPMSELEEEYPGITFVYMTGHVDHWDDSNNKAANQMIRDFVKANNKVLYDFADIESYDPDGNYYEFPHDNCDYYSADGTLSGNWCTEWQNSHEEDVDWWASGAAHSHHINGNLKGYAAWWLWVRLGGWPGINTEPEHDDPNADLMQTKGVQWDRNGSYKSAIDFTTNKSYHVGFTNHWPLNGNTKNRIENALDFTSENDLIFSDNGPYGQYIDIQPGHIIHTTGQVIYSNSARSVGFSVSVWMRPKELKGTIWGQGYGSPCLRFNEYSPGTLRFSIVNQDTGSPYINACPELIPLDEWIHVTCIFDPFEDRLKLYLNGELKTSVETTDGCSIRSTGNFFIGNQEQKSDTHAFIGGLSDIAIWNRVLSDSEVADLAKASSPIGERIESHFVSKRVNKDNDRFSDLMLDWQEENGSADVFISFGGLDWMKVEKGVWISELTDNIQNEIGGYAGFRYRFDFKDAVVLSNLTIQYKHDLPEFDFNGFPLGTNLGKVSYYSIGSSFVDLMIGAEYRNTDGGQNQMNASNEEPRGVHTLSFEGTGTIVIRTGFGDKTFSEPGIYTVPVQEKRNISYYITESSPTDPIRNVKFVMPGFWDTHETQPFHPRFLESLRGMKVLRFMDWARTNTLQEHSWENRPKPNDLVQGGENGISIEYMIKLANTLQIDPWFCIPHFADENYMRGYAELIQSNLDPGLNVYVEYTNEIWNGGFRNSQNWVRDWGEARGLDLPQAVVKRSLQIIEIFNEVLGAERVIGTVAGWSGNINYNESLLQAIDNTEDINTNHTKVDAFAIAPYVGGSIINDIYYAGYENAVTTRDILDMLESTLPEYRNRLQSNKSLADQYGVRLICYEGGQHLVGTGRVVNNRLLTSKMIEANRDPRFYEIYWHYFRIWDEIVGDVFAHFTNYGAFSKYGSWSILESYFVKPGDAPKFRAVRQVADQFEIEQGGDAPIYGNGMIELTEECDNDTFLDNITSCEAYSKRFSSGNLGCSDRGKITTDTCEPALCTLLSPTFDNNHWEDKLTADQEIKLFVQGSACHGEKVTFSVYYEHNTVEGKVLIDTLEASFNSDGFAIAVWNVVVPPDAPRDTLRYFLEAMPEYGDSTWIEGRGWIVENDSGGQPNEAPVVDAGLDQVITLPNNTITLNGVVSDDALPENPGVVVTTWRMISGPEDVTFSDVNALDSNVIFSTSGVYVLNLNANDSDMESNDELTITVESAPILTASRTTGVAPLGVNFTAGVPASVPGSRPFHDLDYVWDFGDPSGNVWAVSGKSKDNAQGPVAAHVFETPGTYTVTLTTSDQGGPISVETVQITIQDPDLVYSETNTICICNTTSNDFTGCPNGAQQISTDDVSDIKSAVASGKRILLNRGSSWNSDGTDSTEMRIGYNIVGPVTIGAYGNCANPDERGICENAPVINLNYPIPYGDPGYEYPTFFSISRASDWRIKDISFIGNYDYDIMAGGAIDIGPFLFLRLKTTGFRLAISISLSQSTGHDQLMVVDSDLSDAYINVMYAGYENMAVMGNSFRDARTSHVVRIWQAYNAVISHNCISGASLDNNNGRHALKLHGLSEDTLTDQYGSRERTRFVVLADNVFGTSGPWTVCIGPQDSLKDQRLTDIIVEKNRFFADYGNLSSRLVSRPLIVWARDVSVRNNIFDGNGSDPSYAAVVIEQRGIEPLPSGIMVSNNTIYKTNSDNVQGAWNYFAGVQVENTAGNIGVFNNLVVFPENSKGELIAIIRNMDDSQYTESNNLLIQGSYSGLKMPDLPNHLKRDFSLLNNSPAIDQGITIQLLRDFAGVLRPVNGVFDIGAFEYIDAPKLKQVIIILKVLAAMDPGGVDLAKITDNDGILDMQDVLNILKSVSGTIQEPETLTPYSIDRDGWSYIPVCEDTKTVYVSSSEGDDSNDGLRELSPVKTLERGQTLLREGFPDRMLLKCGDVWTNESLRIKMGRNTQERMVFGYYGDSESRPLILVRSNGGLLIPHMASYVAVSGIDFYADVHDPNSSNYRSENNHFVGINFVGSGDDILIEDCIFRFFINNIVQGFTNEHWPTTRDRWSNVSLRRNMFLNNYSENSHSAGGYFSRIDGLLFEENLFDYNGWNEDAGVGATMFSHNLYIQGNCSGVVSRNNIFARAASHGTHQRSGGLAENNLYVQNSIGLQLGYDAQAYDYPNGVIAEARNNVVLDGKRMSLDPSATGTTMAVWGIRLENVFEMDITNNIVAHRRDPGSTVGITQRNDVTYQSNIIYMWRDDQNMSDPNWIDPERSVDSYHALIGGSGTLEVFLEEAVSRPVHQWWSEYSAAAVNEYIRQGFAEHL